MTRRDYVFLSDCFALTLAAPDITLAERRGVAKAARDMAYKLALANPRFDQVLFLRNCGLAGVAESIMAGCPNFEGSYGGTD